MPEGLGRWRASVPKRPFCGACAVTLGHLCSQLLLFPPLWHFLSSISKIISLSCCLSYPRTCKSCHRLPPLLGRRGAGAMAGGCCGECCGCSAALRVSWLCFLPPRRLLSACPVREQPSPRPGSSRSPQSLSRPPFWADSPVPLARALLGILFLICRDFPRFSILDLLILCFTRGFAGD